MVDFARGGADPLPQGKGQRHVAVTCDLERDRQRLTARRAAAIRPRDMSLLGIDLGTTGVKAVAFSAEGRVLASAYREYPLQSPRPGWAELDGRLVWRRAEEVLKEAAAKTRRDPIRAIASSSQGEAVVPVDRKGKVLARSMVSFDNRSTAEVKRLVSGFGIDRLFKITGHPLNTTHTLPKLMWVKKHEPKIIRQTAKFLCFGDYALYRLTRGQAAGGAGGAATDYSLAGRTMFFDIRKRRWNEELLGLAGVRLDQMSEPVPSGTPVGEVPAKIAKRLGLPKGVTVVAGGHDQPAGALGAGVTRPGLALDSIGTVECLVISLPKPVLNSKMLKSNFCSYHHTAPGLYVTLAYNFTGGSLLRWYRDTLAQFEREAARRRGRDVYDLICGDMPAGPTGLLVLPHFTTTGTPHFDPHSKGAILGLTLGTTRAEIVKGLLEGISYEMAHNLELLKAAGVKVKEVRASGGGAKSAAWAQLKADIYGLPVAVPDSSEAVSLGAAILAGVGIGEYADVDEGVRATVRIKRVFRPDRKRAKAYRAHLERYKEVYPRLADLFHRMRP